MLVVCDYIFSGLRKCRTSVEREWLSQAGRRLRCASSPFAAVATAQLSLALIVFISLCACCCFCTQVETETGVWLFFFSMQLDDFCEMFSEPFISLLLNVILLLLYCYLACRNAIVINENIHTHTHTPAWITKSRGKETLAGDRCRLAGTHTHTRVKPDACVCKTCMRWS